MLEINNTKEAIVSKEIIPRLLIIDDNADILELFRVILTEVEQIPEKYIEFAENGYEALKLLKFRNGRNFPHIIITDFKMHLMDGITFCHQLYLKYKKISDSFVVIFYSGVNDGTLEERTKELFKKIKGTIRYKPYNISSLIIDAQNLLYSD